MHAVDPWQSVVSHVERCGGFGRLAKSHFLSMNEFVCRNSGRERIQLPDKSGLTRILCFYRVWCVQGVNAVHTFQLVPCDMKTVPTLLQFSCVVLM